MSKRTLKVLFVIHAVLLAVLAVLLTAFFHASRLPFGFILDSAKIIRMPNRGWVVYVFPADFNSIVPEVKSELTSLGFKEGGAPFDDPNETRRFEKTYTDGSVHEVELYNKKLGSAGKSAAAGEWVSISSHDDHYLRRRIQRFIRRTKRLISRNRDT